MMARFGSILLLLLSISTNAAELRKFYDGRAIMPSVSCPEHLRPPTVITPIADVPAPLWEEHAVTKGAVVKLDRVDHVIIGRASASKTRIATFAGRPVLAVKPGPEGLSIERAVHTGMCAMQFEGEELVGLSGEFTVVLLQLAPSDEVRVYKDGLLVHGEASLADIRALLVARRPDAFERLSVHDPLAGDDLLGLLRVTREEAARLKTVEVAKTHDLSGQTLNAILGTFLSDDHRLTVLRRLVGRTVFAPGDASAVLDGLMRPDAQAGAAELMLARSDAPNEIMGALAFHAIKPRVARALAAKLETMETDDLITILAGTRLDAAALEILETLRGHVELRDGQWPRLLETLSADTSRLRALTLLRESPRGLSDDDAVALLRLVRTPDLKRRMFSLLEAELSRLPAVALTKVFDQFKSPYAVLELVRTLGTPLDDAMNEYLDRRFTGFATQTLEAFRAERAAESMRARAMEATGLRIATPEL